MGSAVVCRTPQGVGVNIVDAGEDMANHALRCFRKGLGVGVYMRRRKTLTGQHQEQNQPQRWPLYEASKPNQTHRTSRSRRPPPIRTSIRSDVRGVAQLVEAEVTYAVPVKNPRKGIWHPQPEPM